MPVIWRRLWHFLRSLRPLQPVPRRIVFLPHNAYHTRNLALCVPWLEAAGAEVIFVDVGTHYHAEGAGDTMRELGLPQRPYTSGLLFELRPSVLVVMNDWGGVVAETVRLANRLGVETVGLVEGVQDFEDTDVRHFRQGRLRHPYRTVRHPLLIGAYDRCFIRSPTARVVGLPRVEPLYREDPVFPDPPLAVINSNFTYGVYLSEQPAWIAAAIEGCRQAGIDFVISQHPSDHKNLSGFPVTPLNLYDILRQATLVISRFSTVLLEAMALGKPVIYFNPHKEGVETFTNPMGAYPIATDAPSLRAGIRTCLSYADRYPEVCHRFLHHHVLLNEEPAAQRMAGELLRLLGITGPGTPERPERAAPTPSQSH